MRQKWGGVRTRGGLPMPVCVSNTACLHIKQLAPTPSIPPLPVGDLYEDLKRSGGQLKERQVAGEVLPPFMAALAHMHARRIIHRDIKPENILLAGDRGVRVADFGLSINWGEERPVTRAGTLDYMSPEVLVCPEKSRPEENKERVELGYGEAVDVWAVGVLAHELLVGRPPFERESREETYACISRKEPALPGWMSEPAKDFITTALAKVGGWVIGRIARIAGRLAVAAAGGGCAYPQNGHHAELLHWRQPALLTALLLLPAERTQAAQHG